MGVDDGAWCFISQLTVGSMSITKSMAPRVALGIFIKLCAYRVGLGRQVGWIYHFLAAGSIFGG